MVASDLSPQASLKPSVRSGAATLSYEDIATIPKPGSQGLGMIAFSPDDRYITYLGSADSTSLRRQLYVFDRQAPDKPAQLVIAPRDGAGEEKTFSREEQLRRERARIMSTGLTQYAWASRANRFMFPMDGALHVQDGVGEGATASLRRLFDPTDGRWTSVGSGPILDAKISEDGEYVFFVWEDEVMLACVCEQLHACWLSSDCAWVCIA